MSTIARTPAEVATLTMGKEPTTAEEREEWARLRDAIAADRAARVEDLPASDAVAADMLVSHAEGATFTRVQAHNLIAEAVEDERARVAPVVGIVAAVDALASIASGMYDAEALGGLTCAEVEAIAEVLRAGGHDEAAATIVDAHAHGDDDEGDEHHGRFLEIEAEHAAMDARIYAERAAASAPVRRCAECRAQIEADDMGAGHGMCGGCLHDAIRSGWEPGAGA